MPWHLFLLLKLEDRQGACQSLFRLYLKQMLHPVIQHQNLYPRKRPRVLH